MTPQKNEAGINQDLSQNGCMVVIADDFTGAAELAGISLQYGLSIALFLTPVAGPVADVVIICTNSRSMDKKAAQTATAETLKAVLLWKPYFIYKKIDSVFRGHVLDELKTQLEETGQDKALIVAANPSLGRTIDDGKYFIDGKKISETGFAADPEFPVHDSSVLKMLRSSGGLQIKKPADHLHGTGMILGEAVSAEDITAWAAKVDTGWALAGAGDFFTALLDKKFQRGPGQEANTVLPHLFVSGTTYDKSRAQIAQFAGLGYVAYLPALMLQNGKAVKEEWLGQACGILQKHNRAVIAIEASAKQFNLSATDICTIMAKAVKAILQRHAVKELFIEGGATAAAILEELGITKLLAVHELQRGVVRMQAGDLLITVKPGSYALPQQIKELYSSS
ncbi:MAG: four-carbon acid sugar kinase family protein [Ferruginibacter sp.]